MGLILSRWKKKKTTVEVLDILIKKIDWLEQKRQGNMVRQRRVVSSLIAYSIFLYLASAILTFLYWMPDQLLWKALYCLPFLIFPLLIWAIKRSLHWYYVKNIKRNEDDLEKFKAQKISLLNQVKATETYNVAQELLQRFDPDNNINNTLLDNQLENSLLSNGVQSPKNFAGSTSTLRHRGKLAKSLQSDKGLPKSPTPPTEQPPHLLKLPFNMPQKPLLRDRTFFDRLVDYLMGDGPGSRYALVCSNCHCHNGLAIKEEFEYMTYRCSYCSFLNQAPKHKPTAPSINLLNQSVISNSNQPPNQPNNQSITQPINHSTPKHCTSQPITFSTPKQVINPEINQEINQEIITATSQAIK